MHDDDDDDGGGGWSWGWDTIYIIYIFRDWTKRNERKESKVSWCPALYY